MTPDEVYAAMSRNAAEGRFVGSVLAVVLVVQCVLFVIRIAGDVLVDRKMSALLLEVKVLLRMMEIHGQVTDTQAQRIGNFAAQVTEVTTKRVGEMTKTALAATKQIEGVAQEVREVKEIVKSGNGHSGTIHVPEQTITVDDKPPDG